MFVDKIPLCQPTTPIIPVRLTTELQPSTVLAASSSKLEALLAIDQSSSGDHSIMDSFKIESQAWLEYYRGWNDEKLDEEERVLDRYLQDVFYQDDISEDDIIQIEIYNERKILEEHKMLLQEGEKRLEKCEKELYTHYKFISEHTELSKVLDIHNITTKEIEELARRFTEEELEEWANRRIIEEEKIELQTDEKWIKKIKELNSLRYKSVFLRAVIMRRWDEIRSREMDLNQLFIETNQ